MKPRPSCTAASFRVLSRTIAGLLVCLLVAAGPLSAQTATAPGRETTAASVANYALSTDMPVDPEVLVGGLPNGLRSNIGLSIKAIEAGDGPMNVIPVSVHAAANAAFSARNP